MNLANEVRTMYEQIVNPNTMTAYTFLKVTGCLAGTAILAYAVGCLCRNDDSIIKMLTYYDNNKYDPKVNKKNELLKL